MYREQATFYRAALLLGLMRGDSALSPLCEERESPSVDPLFDDELRALLVEVRRARHGLGAERSATEIHVREWMSGHAIPS